jgi:hypothetical protein
MVGNTNPKTRLLLVFLFSHPELNQKEIFFGLNQKEKPKGKGRERRPDLPLTTGQDDTNT